MSIVQESKDLRRLLRKRFKELKMSYNDITLEAGRYGIFTSKTQLCNYFGPFSIKRRQFPMENVLIFLCFRYSIDIQLVMELKPLNHKLGRDKAELYFGKPAPAELTIDKIINGKRRWHESRGKEFNDTKARNALNVALKKLDAQKDG